MNCSSRSDSVYVSSEHLVKESIKSNLEEIRPSLLPSSSVLLNIDIITIPMNTTLIVLISQVHEEQVIKMETLLMMAINKRNEGETGKADIIISQCERPNNHNT